MITDQQGNALAGASPEAARLFGEALEAFNLYRGDPAGLLTRAMEAAPQFGMAHAFMAWLALISTEPAMMAAGRGVIAHLETLPRDARVDAHLQALRLVSQGEWTAGAQSLGRYSSTHPHDLLALQVGHLLDFARADARSLRDRIARALPQWSPDIPGYPLLLGMHAFGLEECGNYAQAEDSGRRAVALQPLDAWAHHAVAHVMEMQGRAEDGIGWMLAREQYWGAEENFFKVHNWWHRALFHLDIGQLDEALALYDGPVREAGSQVAYDLVDASALLWRLHLLGNDPGERWQELATAWDARADGRSYPFNDWHAVMAWLGAGRDGDVQRAHQACREAAAAGNESSRWAVAIGLPLIEGFTAFWRKDYATAIDRLYAARPIAYAFGGSNAQRDIIDWTLAEAALRGRQGGLARALVQERLALKPRSLANRSLLSRVHATLEAAA